VRRAAALPVCGSGWNIVPSPNTNDPRNSLAGVTALAADDAWAVGEHSGRTLTQHWDGRSWSIIPSPNVRGVPSQLLDVSGSAPDDVWAVGTAGQRALIEHWDGSAWRVVPAPTRGSLHDVAALGPGFALAVGFQQGKHEPRPLALRWNGDAWVEVVTVGRGDPDPVAFTSVSATSRRDAWAVGFSWPVDGLPAVTMTQHWNGTEFRLVPMPTPEYGFDILNGVTTITSDDAWAVGQSADVSPGSTIPSLTEHWDGDQWRIVPSPNREFPGFDRPQTFLRSVDAVTADEVWAIGYAQAFNDDGVTPFASPTRTLAMRWNGQRWRIVETPNAADFRHNELEDVTALSDGHAWAVGNLATAGGQQRTLIMARC
jgi:hypothetical protein